jgi:hypothetical protein
VHSTCAAEKHCTATCSDSRLARFTLRVQPTGVRSYYARFGRNRRFALGKVGALRPDEARDKCQKVLGNVAHGRHPLHGLNGEGLTLGQFIEESYVPWVKANRPRTAANTLENSSDTLGPGMPSPSRPLLQSVSNYGKSGA